MRYNHTAAHSRGGRFQEMGFCSGLVNGHPLAYGRSIARRDIADGEFLLDLADGELRDLGHAFVKDLTGIGIPEDFDITDLAAHLVRLGYDGALRAYTRPLPAPHVVAAEFKADWPKLDFDLIELPNP